MSPCRRGMLSRVRRPASPPSIPRLINASGPSTGTGRQPRRRSRSPVRGPVMCGQAPGAKALPRLPHPQLAKREFRFARVSECRARPAGPGGGLRPLCPLTPSGAGPGCGPRRAIETLVAPSSAGEIVGYRSVIRRRLDVLRGHDRHGDAELLHARWQVAMQPVRHARRQRRDDHLVERLALERLAHSDERVGVADEALDMVARRVLQERDGELQGERRLLRLGVPVGTRHEQHEAARLLVGASAHLVQEPGRARRAVRHDQDASRGGGLRVDLLSVQCLTRAGPPGGVVRAVALPPGSKRRCRRLSVPDGCRTPLAGVALVGDRG